MTLLPAYKPDAAGISLDAIKAQIAGKNLGQLLAIRGDLAERISHFDNAPNEFHAGDQDGTPYGTKRPIRDLEMNRLARLRAELAYVTDEISSGRVKET